MLHYKLSPPRRHSCFNHPPDDPKPDSSCAPIAHSEWWVCLGTANVQHSSIVSADTDSAMLSVLCFCQVIIRFKREQERPASPCSFCLPTIATALITVAISLYLIGFTAVIRSPGTPGPLLSYRSGGLTPEVNHRLSAVMRMALFDRIAVLEAEHNPQIKHALEEARRNNSSMELLFWAPLTIDGHTVIT